MRVGLAPYLSFVRFTMTRLWSVISLEQGNRWLKQIVLDAQEVVKGEIWSITLLSVPRDCRAHKTTIHVLEDTCEVIGYAPQSKQSSDYEDVNLIPMRADWSSYISARLENSERAGGILATRMKWANHEDYESGVAKIWLSRIAKENHLSEAKRLVAKRYILACVVSNRSVNNFIICAKKVC